MIYDEQNEKNQYNPNYNHTFSCNQNAISQNVNINEQQIKVYNTFIEVLEDFLTRL